MTYAMNRYRQLRQDPEKTGKSYKIIWVTEIFQPLEAIFSDTLVDYLRSP